MPPLVPNQAEEDALVGLAGTAGANLWVRLLKVARTPLVGDSPDDYVEATFPGYAPANGGWSGPVDDGAGNRVMVSPALVWTRGSGGAGEVIYGWMVTRGIYPDWRLVAVSMFGVPRPMDVAGLTLPLQIALLVKRG